MENKIAWANSIIFAYPGDVDLYMYFKSSTECHNVTVHTVSFWLLGFFKWIFIFNTNFSSHLMSGQNVASHIVWVSQVFFFFFFVFIHTVVGSRLIVKYYTASIQSRRVLYVLLWIFIYVIHIRYGTMSYQYPRCAIYSFIHWWNTQEKNVYWRFTCFIVRRSPSTYHSPFADVSWLLVFRYRYIIFPGNQYTLDIWYHIWNNFSFGSSVINFPERLRECTSEWARER